jgi:hypothetical protein
MMKPAVALVALFISACAGSATETITPPVADSCAVARPDFGGVATAADRSLFVYDVNAPLNLQKAVESGEHGAGNSGIVAGSFATTVAWPAR